MYTIQNNTLVTNNVLNFNHHHSLIKVSIIHEEFEYLKFIQQNINPYVTLFNRLIYKEMKLCCSIKLLKYPIKIYGNLFLAKIFYKI